MPALIISASYLQRNDENGATLMAQFYTYDHRVMLVLSYRNSSSQSTSFLNRQMKSQNYRAEENLFMCTCLLIPPHTF